jgi:hypothetical protein
MEDERPANPEHSPDAVDVSPIRWMLSLTPAQRLATLQKHISSVLKIRATLKPRA